YDAELLSDQPGFAETFMPGGHPPRAGDRFVNPGLARSLVLIAKTKGRAFYEGELSEAIAADARRHGSALTEEDLAAHSCDWCGTISKSAYGATLHEIPPNGQGIAALMALGILAHTQIRDCAVDTVEALHLQIEAMKLALRDSRAYVGDLAHMTRIRPESLLDDTYLATRAGEIDLARAIDFGAGAPRGGGTVYLATADDSGMMVSFIQSNYSGFGSGVAIPGTGIHLQNRGAGFSLDPASQNHVGPHKRPFHTIIPGFLMGPEGPLMSFGVMGGPIQAQGHLQVVLRTQLWGQDPQVAVDAPRWRVMEGLDVACEPAISDDVLERLVAMGHRITL
ncbi:MAG: gamma-glutamyltransferase, partial [bacterium]|nr:gamma-glutamyltransferase [bacterium]